MDTNQIQEEKQKPQISGWLAIFLGLGVGLGAAVSCVTNVIQLADLGWSPIAIMMVVCYLGPLATVAALTIKAFYKSESNAVALGVTYLLMIAIDGIVQIVVGSITDDYSGLKDLVRQFVWFVIWLVYLLSSEQVKALIPVEKREWKLPEKILIIVYITACVLFTMSVKKSIDDPFNSHFLSKQILIEQYITEINKEYPSMCDGMLIEGVDLDGKTVVYKYKYPETAIADMNMDYVRTYCISLKQETLWEYAVEPDSDIIEINDLFFLNGYSLEYRYSDMNDEIAYTFTATPKEYKAARKAGEDFRCDKAAWEEILAQANSQLPSEYLGNCSLTNASVDFDAQTLNFDIMLPEMDAMTLNALTEEYLKNYILDNLYSFSDGMWTMAKLDKMSIHFHFMTSAGDDHADVDIACAEYESGI